MKYYKILILVAIISFTVTNVLTQDDEPKRTNILLRRANSRTGPLSKTTTTTTTTTNGPAEYDDGEDIEYDQDELNDGEKAADTAVHSSSTTTTSTEPSRKIGPIIRPLRTDDALLSLLKRRQMSAKKVYPKDKPVIKDTDEISQEEPVPTSISNKSTATTTRRRFGPSKQHTASDIDESSKGAEHLSTSPTKKRFASRSARSN